MNKVLKMGFMALLVLTSYSSLQASDSQESSPPQALSVKEATKQCERDVGQNCTTTLCPQYCEAMFSNRKNNKEALIADCKQKCTPDKNCQIKPLAASATSDPLEAQTREQLFQCIAEKRDPEGKTSGRRMIAWQEVTTPSWRKLLSLPEPQ